MAFLNKIWGFCFYLNKIHEIWGQNVIKIPRTLLANPSPTLWLLWSLNPLFMFYKLNNFSCPSFCVQFSLSWNVVWVGETLVLSFFVSTLDLKEQKKRKSFEDKNLGGSERERRKIKHSEEEKLCKSAINKLRHEANKFAFLCDEGKVGFRRAEEKLRFLPSSPRRAHSDGKLMSFEWRENPEQKLFHFFTTFWLCSVFYSKKKTGKSFVLVSEKLWN